ncbi:hypothetical protein VNO77_03559 [Canavalia gladiata]|uniref:Uncharacterized protein n=1 Tax=Canavalia gladiata TaxID=3824 RepID=A0AAN9R6Y7_CANGL
MLHTGVDDDDDVDNDDMLRERRLVILLFPPKKPAVSDHILVNEDDINSLAKDSCWGYNFTGGGLCSAPWCRLSCQGPQEGRPRYSSKVITTEISTAIGVGLRSHANSCIACALTFVELGAAPRPGDPGLRVWPGGPGLP